MEPLDDEEHQRNIKMMEESIDMVKDTTQKVE